jgi:hypothetical protein
MAPQAVNSSRLATGNPYLSRRTGIDRSRIEAPCDRKLESTVVDRDKNLIPEYYKKEIKMTEKRSRGQPKSESTQDQRNQVKLMKALGIPEDRICKTITNPRTRKPVAPMTLARAFAAELESGATEFHALVGNFILCAILGKKPMLGADQKRAGPHDCGDLLRQTQMGWKETVVNEQANKDGKPFLVDDARQRLIDEVDRARARKEQKGE